MGLLEKVYERAPLPFQNLMTTVAGYQKNLTRYGQVYWEHRAFPGV